MSTKEEKETKTIRVIKFHGEGTKWREWAAKTKAIGSKKGWWSEMEQETDIDFTKLTEDPYKDRKVENNAAYHYLLLACTGDAFPYVEASDGNVREAWRSLKARYVIRNNGDLVR